MLENLFGSKSRACVLMYLYLFTEGYTQKIAECCGIGITPVRKQLERLEGDGILTVKNQGKKKVYSLDRMWSLSGELKILLKRAHGITSDPYWKLRGDTCPRTATPTRRHKSKKRARRKTLNPQ